MFESCFLGQDTRRMRHTSQQSRRTFMKKSFMGLGSMAWWHLAMQGEGLSTSRLPGSHPPFHHRPRAKRVIFFSNPVVPPSWICGITSLTSKPMQERNSLIPFAMGSASQA